MKFTPFAAFEPRGAATEPTKHETAEDLAYIGNWIGEASGYEGIRYTLFVDLLADGTAVYKCGPVQSEIMVDCRGTWKAEPAGDEIVLSLVDQYEGFSFDGKYKWSMTDGSLTLQHRSGDAFLYGAEGKSFTFKQNR